MNKNVNITFDEGSSPARITLVMDDDHDYEPEDAIEMSEELIARLRAAETEFDTVTRIISAMHEDRMRPYWEARNKEREALKAEVTTRMTKAVHSVTGAIYWHNHHAEEYQLSTVARTNDSVFELCIRDKDLTKNLWHQIYYGTVDQMKLHLTCLAPRYGIEAQA